MPGPHETLLDDNLVRDSLANVIDAVDAVAAGELAPPLMQGRMVGHIGGREVVEEKRDAFGMPDGFDAVRLQMLDAGADTVVQGKRPVWMELDELTLPCVGSRRPRHDFLAQGFSHHNLLAVRPGARTAPPFLSRLPDAPRNTPKGHRDSVCPAGAPAAARNGLDVP